MTWFYIALIPPALWAATNHIDKYLVSKYFKGGGIGALMIFSSIIGLFILPFILIIHPHLLIQPSIILLIILNGFLYLLATLPYLYALNKDEASVAAPIFQLIPVFSFFLAWFLLKETLTISQILGGVLILAGAIVIAIGLSEKGKKAHLKKGVFLLMLLSSFLYALNFLFFKYFAIQSTFWTTSFWEYVGFVIFGIILFVFIKPYRLEFINVMRKNRVAVLSINGINEVLNIIGKLSFNFASLLAPITLTWIIDGFQPFFILLFGVLLTVFFPHISKEKIVGKHMAQKVIAIFIMFVGAYILNLK